LYTIKFVFRHVVCFPVLLEFSQQSVVYNCHKSVGFSLLSSQSLSVTWNTLYYYYYYHYYYLLQLSFHSVAVVLTLVQTKQIRIIIRKLNHTKYSTNNAKHSKYKYTYYQNTHTIATTPNHYKTHKYTQPHITKPKHTHNHTLQNPHIHTTTHYKTHTNTQPHITKPTHTNTHTLENPHIHTPTH